MNELKFYQIILALSVMDQMDGLHFFVFYSSNMLIRKSFALRCDRRVMPTVTDASLQSEVNSRFEQNLFIFFISRNISKISYLSISFNRWDVLQKKAQKIFHYMVGPKASTES